MATKKTFTDPIDRSNEHNKKGFLKCIGALQSSAMHCSLALERLPLAPLPLDPLPLEPQLLEALPVELLLQPLPVEPLLPEALPEGSHCRCSHCPWWPNNDNNNC